MKRRKPSLLSKITASLFIAMILGVIVFSYALFKFGVQAHAAGSEIPIWKAAAIACLPMCMAILYSMWIVAANSPGDTSLVSSWLRDGWPSKMDPNGRLPIAFDRLVGWVAGRQSKIDAMKAAVVQHDVWRWGLKPIGLGFFAAVAVAPLLFVAPLVGGGYGMRFTFAGARTAALVVWTVATLAYLVARWFGVLDGNDRTRAMRAESGSGRQRVSDLFQDGVVPMTKKIAPQCASESVAHGHPEQVGARRGWVDAESSMRDLDHPQLTPPPDGFEWKFFRNAVFIQPKSWHVIVQEMPAVGDGIGMDVYATSPRQFSPSNPFETGFTVQVMSGLKSGRWHSARHAYAAYIAPLFDRVRKEDFLLLDEKAQGQSLHFVLRYRDVVNGPPSVIVHKFIVVNDALEHVHVFTFESPESSWQEQWTRYGEMILGNVGIARPQEFEPQTRPIAKATSSVEGPKSQFVWSEGPWQAEGPGDGLGLKLNRTFLDVYNINFPDPGDVIRLSEGLLNGNAISYCRIDYKEPLHAFVITSTVPADRSAEVELSMLCAVENNTFEYYASHGKGHRYSVSFGESIWGRVINVRIANVADGSDQGPFPLSRFLLVDDDPLFSVSFHRLFVRGTNRYEIAVLGAPPGDGGESIGEWEKRLESMADRMVVALQASTERMWNAKSQPPQAPLSSE